MRTLLVLILTLFSSSPRLAYAQAPATPASPPEQDNQRDLTISKDKTPGQPPATAPVTIPRSYALVVGISKYKNLPAKAQLQFPDRDAADMYTALISGSAGQFPAENVHKLINDQATLANLNRELEDWLPKVTAPDDRVVIYFAGHGFISGGKAYLAPYDIDPTNIAATAFPMDELGKLIGSRIHGKWKVLLTDACHSGAITPEDDTAQVNKSLLDLNTSIFSLTASRDREQSFESSQWGGGHGIFTYYVIKGLEGEADTSGDGVVTADELAEYVHQNVRLATHTRQNPTSERGSFDPNMVLAYNPGTTAKCDGPNCAGKLRYGTFVIDANMDDTEVWLDGKSLGVFKKGVAQRFPGLTPGPHTITGAHAGYAPDGPREEQIYPGQDTSVSIRILIARQRNHAAVEIFNQGLDHYNKGFESNYKLAVADFQKALTIDPQYSQAALYLGRAYHALYEDDEAKQALKRAIEIDPEYLEARLSYAAVLLDTGDLDEAIRQLDSVTKRDPTNGMAWYLQSQAFVRKGSYSQAVDSGEQAIKYTPANAEAHLWLGEALRKKLQCPEGRTQYETYLSLSNFNSELAGKLNYYLLGSLIGMGTKKRATQQDIWRELRAQAYVGICDCDFLQKNFDAAAVNCQKALTLTPTDLFANYRLGLVMAEQYNQVGGLALLKDARKYFDAVITINPQTDEAERSRKYVANIDSVLAQTNSKP
jgi:tetratricopeptide (TPR) repeat protein